MKKLLYTLAAAASLSITANLKAAVTIGHSENTTSLGAFMSSDGSAPSTGAVSIGFFTSAAPTDSDFGVGKSINGWADLLAHGYVDVRSLPGVTLTAGFDWDNPIPIGGSVQNIPIGSLPANTQLYVFGFNNGTYNTATPSQSFLGATEWAATKDGLSPADLGTRNVFLNAVTALAGTDTGNNINMTALSAVPEPSRFLLLGLGLMGLVLRRRRK